MFVILFITIGSAFCSRALSEETKEDPVSVFKIGGQNVVRVNIRELWKQMTDPDTKEITTEPDTVDPDTTTKSDAAYETAHYDEGKISGEKDLPYNSREINDKSPTSPKEIPFIPKEWEKEKFPEDDSTFTVVVPTIFPPTDPLKVFARISKIVLCVAVLILSVKVIIKRCRQRKTVKNDDTQILVVP